MLAHTEETGQRNPRGRSPEKENVGLLDKTAVLTMLKIFLKYFKDYRMYDISIS